ncbi:hypothetical protein I2483_00670 [Sporosarcina sp. E16_3]|uniref:hypothetical protein n=1 Tax=Sporosarcina sp. E16_3 TaxID=2789293 RepID=UPI001A916B54|nr:hypothetical protein [Sporosarcina sp. E16_3]MBO0600162.1 hypothetical protein [Sporosarcina sp. E16_3]
MVKVKTPINSKDVKERAAKKLNQFSAKESTERANPLIITGQMVKPIHVSNTDPLVRKILNK